MPITETLLAAIFVLFCATLRGFTGFGLAVALVPLLALVMTPQQAVPIVLVLQVAAGLQSLRSDWPHIDWRSIGLLLPGGPYVVFPLIAVLYRAGAGIGPAVTLVTSWATLALISVTFELPFMGWRFTAVRWGLGLIVPLIAGAAAQVLFG